MILGIPQLGKMILFLSVVWVTSWSGVRPCQIDGGICGVCLSIVFDFI